MRETPRWRRYARFWGSDALRDVDEELSLHIELKREELSARGVAAAEIEQTLEREFGDRRRVEAELKEIGMKRMQRARRASLLDEMRVDLRHAWRSFRRRPAVPLVIVLTLALAIGAGTAVFSLLDAVVLSPIPVERPGELVTLGEGEGGHGFSYPMSKLVRERSTTTEGIAGYVSTSIAVRAGDHAEQLGASVVTGNYFAVLGLRPQHGRLLQDADEAAPGAMPYAVLSDAVWRRVYGADPSVVGQSVSINEVPFTIVGIAPPRFRGTTLASPVDVWVPVTMMGTIGRSGLWAMPDILDTWFFNVFQHFARVSPEVPVERVLAELRSLHGPALRSARAEQEADPDAEPLPQIVAMSFNEAAAMRSREDLMRFLMVLASAVGIALTIACVNVANLMLMRARERQRELSIRAAVGASGARVARQLFVECFALALLAGALGAGVALLSMRLLTTFSLPGGIALSDVPMPLDMRMLSFTLAVSAVCALSFGLAPALRGARTDVMDTLRIGLDTGRRRWHGGNIMVAVQVALSLLLLVAGSLLLRSLQQALNVDVGFRTSGVATVAVGLRQHGYTAEEASGFVQQVIEAAERTPAVQHAAAATQVPIAVGGMRLPIVRQDGVAGTRPSIGLIGVTSGYLELMEIPLLRGRGIEPADRIGSPLVAVVTQAAAERIWPDEDPVGRQFVPMFGPPFTVVGVAQDAHYTSLTARDPQIFFSLAQTTNLTGMDMRIVGAGADASAVLAALRSAVRAVDDRLPTFDERNLTTQINTVLMPQRFGALLLGAFGFIALLISAVGIYAVASYDVTRQYRELGIRAALGARGRDLVDAVLSRAALAICAGIIAGLAAAALSTWTLRGLLFGMTPYEPVSYLLAVLVLGVVAVLASWIPARRAARVNPLTVIKG